MRILHMFFIGIAVAALYGCNSSSTGSTESNSAGSSDDTVSENTTSGQAEQYTGPLATIVSLTDVAVHGTVKSIETVYSSDAGEIPHTVANIEITEILFGDYDDQSSNIISIRYVGGMYKDGIHDLAASHNPELTVGDEIVAMIRQRDNDPCWLAQCQKGIFHVEGDLVIADNESAVVVNKGLQTRFISKGARAKGLHNELIEQGSLRNFKNLIASLGKNASAKSKGERMKLTKLDTSQPFEASPALTTGSAAPSTNEEHAKGLAMEKAKHEKYLSTLSAKDRWEYEAFEANGGNPVLPNSYLGEDQQ